MNKFKITYITNYNHDIRSVTYSGNSITTWLCDLNMNGIYDINEQNVVKFEKLMDSLPDNSQDLTQ